jgi:hypothetical protein
MLVTADIVRLEGDIREPESDLGLGGLDTVGTVACTLVHFIPPFSWPPHLCVAGISTAPDTYRRSATSAI